ncbi:MAG: hypothetical protein JSW12_11890 [Deltaproteobacteria bacterium]|nr:MAG: hypothetical protein JSW12_11890 [Deltaproteobacteria bacterium]
MTYADGTLWVGDAGSRGEVLRIDPESGEIVNKYDRAHGCIFGLTTDGKDIFVGEADKKHYFHIEKVKSLFDINSALSSFNEFTLIKPTRLTKLTVTSRFVNGFGGSARGVAIHLTFKD